MEFQQNFPLPPPPPSPSDYYNSQWKQLATLKPKQTTMNTKNHHPSCVVGGGSFSSNQNLSNVTQQQPPQQFKKQNRRRLHSSRPYQERLLNMAEARREIVTALKYHRASMHMRQATQHLQLHHQYLQQQQQQQQEQQQLQHQSVSLSLKPSHSSFNQDGRSKSRRNSRIYPSCKTRFSTHLNDISYSSSFSSRNPPLVPSSYPNHNPVTFPFSYPPPRPPRNPKLTLPNQTSRLNHNAQHFNNLKLLLFPNNNNNHSSCCSYSSPAPSSTPPVTGHDQDVPPIGTPHSQGEGVSSVVDTIESSVTIYSTTRNFHVALDEEGMAEVRSLVEQHQTEWSDTVSFITSAWWFDCLKNMEHGAHDEAMTEDGDDACDIFDELEELNEFHDANESILKQCPEDYFQDPMPW